MKEFGKFKLPKDLIDVTEVKLGNIFGDISSINLWQSYEPAGNAHIAKIREMQEQIRPQLSRYSYVPLGTFL